VTVLDAIINFLHSSWSFVNQIKYLLLFPNNTLFISGESVAKVTIATGREKNLLQTSTTSTAPQERERDKVLQL